MQYCIWYLDAYNYFDQLRMTQHEFSTMHVLIYLQIWFDVSTITCTNMYTGIWQDRIRQLSQTGYKEFGAMCVDTPTIIALDQFDCNAIVRSY